MDEIAMLERVGNLVNSLEIAGKRIAELESKLQGCENERDALRRELERLQPTTCNKYLEDNLCLKKKGHEGECLWFPF